MYHIYNIYRLARRWCGAAAAAAALLFVFFVLDPMEQWHRHIGNERGRLQYIIYRRPGSEAGLLLESACLFFDLNLILLLLSLLKQFTHPFYERF